MRVAPFTALVLIVLLAGCFSSDTSLYGDQKPVTPLHSGAVEVVDLAHPKAHKEVARLELGNNGVYKLTRTIQHSEEITRFRLFPLDALLVAETSDGCNRKVDENCNPQTGSEYKYALVRVTAGRVEWRAPDCSPFVSKLAGAKVGIDECHFYDRATLEKALHIAAAAPWKADGAYIIH